LLPPLQPIINWQNTNPRIRPSERDVSLALFPVVNFLSYGSFWMEKRKWVSLGSSQSKTSPANSGEGGFSRIALDFIALQRKETLSGPCTEAISRKV
jgi:hypothetical protein